jgi:hypothetical protein
MSEINLQPQNVFNTTIIFHNLMSFNNNNTVAAADHDLLQDY